MSWEIVIGLEIHVQMNTKTKAFCNDRNLFGDEANSHISPITLAHPGTLPRINKIHIESAIKCGLAFGSTISQESYFDRKNYFYPDLPKGYQITQDERPICIGGKCPYIMGDGTIKEVTIHHVHMEEDAGKSIHDLSPSYTYLDYNRAGVPLLEIVTEPDLNSSEEVYHFIASLQQLVRHLGISDGNMEEGSFRCDCNVSVRKKGDPKLGERCEIKNLNSKRFAKAAIEYEASRQIEIISNGGSISKTTMLYNPDTGRTYPMRDKEDVNDYRYFNDPDLPPMIISDNFLKKLTEDIEKMPVQQYQLLRTEHQLSHDDSMVLIDDSLFLHILNALIDNGYDAKEAALLIVNKIAPLKNIQEIRNLPETILINKLSSFLELIRTNKISKSAAYNQLFEVMWKDNNISLLDLAKKLEILQHSDQSFVSDIATQVVNQFPDKVKAYKSGKKGLIGFFMGQAMKISKGKANPQILQKELESALNS